MIRIRNAVMEDLPLLNELYIALIHQMDQDGICIWDDIYPCICLPDDIRNQCCYVLVEDETIIAAFALCNHHQGAAAVTWHQVDDCALYMDRLGVNVTYQGKGMGSRAMQEAISMAKAQKADTLRLFVVDINKPAIRLYEKNGFTVVEGCYDEVIDETLTLHEYGYELTLY